MPIKKQALQNLADCRISPWHQTVIVEFKRDANASHDKSTVPFQSIPMHLARGRHTVQVQHQHLGSGQDLLQHLDGRCLHWKGRGTEESCRWPPDVIVTKNKFYRCGNNLYLWQFLKLWVKVILKKSSLPRVVSFPYVPLPAAWAPPSSTAAFCLIQGIGAGSKGKICATYAQPSSGQEPISHHPCMMHFCDKIWYSWFEKSADPFKNP